MEGMQKAEEAKEKSEMSESREMEEMEGMKEAKKVKEKRKMEGLQKVESVRKMEAMEKMEEAKKTEKGKKCGDEDAILEEQVRYSMRVIKQGAADLIGEEELEEKLRRSILTGNPLIIKFGMDPSAPDIHLGHAVALRKLKQIQDLGHKIVVVIGDFTGRIGDPTGRSKGRKALTDKEVLVNAQTYQEQIFHILDREKTQVRYNGEWLELLGLSEMLELASTITVARMLERDDFQNRFRNGIPIGLHEFFYPLMQAYDSVVLKADLELGGTDQTFNVLMGRSLQKERGQERQAALFMPVLEGIDGVEKMSKSMGNYIGVHEDARTMFTKVMQIPDSLIIKYFELATDIRPEELDRVKEELADGGNPRDTKLLLARTITALYNGEEEAEAAERFFREAFTNRQIPEDVDTLQVVLERENLLDCIRPLVNGGYVGSGAEFRRLVAQGGVQRNGEQIKAMEEKIQAGDVLKVGKRKFVRIEKM